MLIVGIVLVAEHLLQQLRHEIVTRNIPDAIARRCRVTLEGEEVEHDVFHVVARVGGQAISAIVRVEEGGAGYPTLR